MSKWKRILPFWLLLSLISGQSSAQDGSILKTTSVSLSQDIISNIYEVINKMPNLRFLINDLKKRSENIDINEITYLSEGLKVKGFLLEPKKDGTYPCLIINRGGNRNFGIWTKEEVFLLLSTISHWGYVVVASQYRGSAGGEGKEEIGGQDVNNILSLIPLLESRKKTDAKKIGMLGLSRGGMMSYISLSRTDRIKTAVILGGITDLFSWEKSRPDMKDVFIDLIGSDSKSNPDAFKSRSAVFWPEKISLQNPLLIIHGQADERVPPTQALNLASALIEVNQPFRLVTFERADHNLTEFWPEWLGMVQDWFKRYLD